MFSNVEDDTIELFTPDLLIKTVVSPKPDHVKYRVFTHTFPSEAGSPPFLVSHALIHASPL